ncbi:MAG: nucleotidyltransferase domain-containing protein [Synergistaceae bacterium]|nr:nucleotidyltransferase domain-containing protein [Synergistaceae bacterium]
MSVDIGSWCADITGRLRESYGEALLFVGLQGSYGRGEERPESDIDLVVILKSLSVKELDMYRALLDEMPRGELACGFIAGESELACWRPSELFHLYFDTTPLYGSLEAVRGLFDEEAARQAVKEGGCAIYHGCVHNYLYEKSEEALAGLCKLAFFTLRAKYFAENGYYVKKMSELSALLSGEEKKLLEIALSFQSGKGGVPFRELSELLIDWSAGIIAGY